MYKAMTHRGAFAMLMTAGLLTCGSYAWGAQAHIKPYTFKADSGSTVAAQWGTFKVPLHHGVTDGKTLELAFVRFKSTNPHPGNPIVYLAGGPGGSGIAAARGKRFPLFMALRQVADVIALDQRGTGASNSIPPCSATKPFPLTLTGAAEHAYIKDAVDHCVAFWKSRDVDLSAYNTHENALDLENLRKALGAKKLNLWGISYGSTLALAALKVMPEHIDRVVLASPLSVSQVVRLPARTQDFLVRVDALLKADPKLNAVYPDLLGTMKAVHDRLAQNPVHVTLESPEGKPVTLTLDRSGLQSATAHMLKNPDTLRLLPIAYYAMAAGQFQAIVKPIYASLGGPLALSGMAVGMRATSCISPERARVVAQQADTALLGDALNTFTEILQGTATSSLSTATCQPVHSAVPALLLTGTLDGRTYPAGHAEILEGLPNGTEVVIENAGHDLFMSSPKVSDDIVDFLSHEPVRHAHIKVPPPAFMVPPRAGPTAGR